jgi:hypothetical protein
MQYWHCTKAANKMAAAIFEMHLAAFQGVAEISD